jgi:hypothetical protein
MSRFGQGPSVPSLAGRQAVEVVDICRVNQSSAHKGWRFAFAQETGLWYNKQRIAQKRSCGSLAGLEPAAGAPVVPFCPISSLVEVILTDCPFVCWGRKDRIP